MTWRIIDVARDGRYLHTDRNWLVIAENRVEIGMGAVTGLRHITAVRRV